MSNDIFEGLRGGLIVSCQAPLGSPLRRPGMMAIMAEAAEEAGAVAIRAEGIADISSIRDAVRLPILGLIKLQTSDTPVIITPLLEHIDQLISAGADLIAVDATFRKRSDGRSGPEFIEQIRDCGVPIVADVDHIDAAIAAGTHGAAAVSTTLSGYTDGSVPRDPDIDLVAACAGVCSVPVIAEGRYATPEQVSAAFRVGAWSVCVGGAITDPWKTTKRFIEDMHL